MPAWKPMGPEPFIPFINWNRSTTAGDEINFASFGANVTPIIIAGSAGVESATI